MELGKEIKRGEEEVIERMKREAAARRARDMLAERTPHHFQAFVLVQVLHLI